MKHPQTMAGLALGLALALGTAPTLAVAEEGATGQQEVPKQRETLMGHEGDSFRYRNGRPINSGLGATDDGLGDGLVALADSPEAWIKNDKGEYVNDEGKVIEGAFRRGVDVSEFQGYPDWEKLQKQDISFAIIRCGGMGYESRKMYEDGAYEYNAAELERLGIPYGVYFFSTAFTVEDAVREAEFTIEQLKGLDVSLPVYYDLEYEGAAAVLSASEWADIATTWCDMIEEAGYTPGVYASTYWWNHHLTDPVFDEWTRWVAQYNSECQYGGAYDMWQCSSQVALDGIVGTVDLNMDYGIPEDGSSPRPERTKTEDGAKDEAKTEDGTKDAAKDEAEPETNDRDKESEVWTRLWGDDAIGTMKAIVDEGWDSADLVVIASKNGYWDALSASSLAGSSEVPVLLTGADALDKGTTETINGLGATKAIIVGGTMSVSDDVVAELEDLGLEVERIAGRDAASTARKVADTFLSNPISEEDPEETPGETPEGEETEGDEGDDYVGEGDDYYEYDGGYYDEYGGYYDEYGNYYDAYSNFYPQSEEDGEAPQGDEGSDAASEEEVVGNQGRSDTCIVASSTGYWDALSASSLSYAKRMPIFLAGEDGLLSEATLAAIEGGSFTDVIIVGGEQSVSDEVEGQLGGIGFKPSKVKRLWGETAVETSVEIAKHALKEGLDVADLGVASNAGYWDALTGGAFCGHRGSVLLLVDSEDSSVIEDFVEAKKDDIDAAYAFGGKLSVGYPSFNALVNVTG